MNIKSQSRATTTWLIAIATAAISSGIAISVNGAERDLEAAKAAARGQSPDMVQPKHPARLPDWTKGAPLPSRGGEGQVLWQMGPCGIVGVRNGGSAGDQVCVFEIHPGSPAEGKVWPGDVILGVQGKDFVAGGDLNRSVGNAIIKAEEEAGKGIFTLHIGRDANRHKREAAMDVRGADVDELIKKADESGATFEWEGKQGRDTAVKQILHDRFPVEPVHTNVTLKLKIMGTYSDTSPWDCPVATKIREDAWAWLATGKGNGRGPGGQFWTSVLALVGSGKPEYVELARKWVSRQGLCQDMEVEPVLKPGAYLSWKRGFSSLDLAIYYDATGDKTVLPELRYRAIETAKGQNGGGSWGHTFSFPHQNGGMLHQHNPGYGAMNNAGGRCFFLLALARKAGIKHPELDAAIERAQRFFGGFVDKGVLGYGYGEPVGTDDSNGKNYGATYAFHALGEKHKAKFFSMHSASASFTRRGGHGSPTLWYFTPLSAHLSGPRAVQAYMRNMRYFYTLSRCHDGSFVFLGEQAPGIGGGVRNPTATVALHYSAPLKQLMITGKDVDEKDWMNDEEFEELLVGAAGQLGDPELLKRAGVPWAERSTDELLDMLDHFVPTQRQRYAAVLKKHYDAGEQDIVTKVLPLLESEEARMRDGACRVLGACGPEVVTAHLAEIITLLKDSEEFVRMTAARTIGGGTEPGNREAELALLHAAVDEYEDMSADHANVRSAIRGVLFSGARAKSKLATDPFDAGYDADLVRAAMARIVALDPGGTVPAGWSRDTLLKLAGVITFAAEELQLNDAMFGGARKTQGQALLRKFGYREAIDGDVFNLMRRTALDRNMRRRVGFKGHYITPGEVKKAPGLYRDYLDELRLWQQDSPTHVVVGERGEEDTPLDELIALIEQDETQTPRSVSPDVSRAFASELAAAGSRDDRIELCRKELEGIEEKNYFRKMAAMTSLVELLGADAVDDVSPYLGHPYWRLRKHANKVAADLVARGSGARLIALFQRAQARKVELSDNWNAAGIIAALGDAQHEPALSAARAALNHADAAVRSAAVLAVYRIGGDAELETVFDSARRARGPKDMRGVEQALLSKRDDPAFVTRVSAKVRAILNEPERPLRRSMAWVLGQFGGAENLAAIQQAAIQSGDDGDLREMITALAYSPDRAADKTMLELAARNTRLREAVRAQSVHRMVGPNGASDVTDEQRVAFARGMLTHGDDMGLIAYLGRRVHTGPSVRLLFDVMKEQRSDTDKVMEAIIECAEGIKNPSKRDNEVVADVLTQVIEYIDVTKLRGGLTAEKKESVKALAAYDEAEAQMVKAGKLLERFARPEEADMPEFDNSDIDL